MNRTIGQWADISDRCQSGHYGIDAATANVIKQAVSDLQELARQRNELAILLARALPAIKLDAAMQDACYGTNFVEHRAKDARELKKMAKAAIAKIKEQTK